MAVTPNATPLDRALDEAGRLLERATSDDAAIASRAMHLWERVFVEAVRSGEPRVATAAWGEYAHFREVLSALIRAPSG